ncbi:hypothetical protein MUK42_01329 [Musa troglodytarum]|uniref:Uncharacterized protein n=1 Tax=Musa troglodytarum TaxID=320322 RepID=A0A9E7EM27_9LILI|nr:hypothetical protein MUK42_01329 [Musa troglodytarum]
MQVGPAVSSSRKRGGKTGTRERMGKLLFSIESSSYGDGTAASHCFPTRLSVIGLTIDAKLVAVWCSGTTWVSRLPRAPCGSEIEAVGSAGPGLSRRPPANGAWLGGNGDPTDVEGRPKTLDGPD